MVSPKDCFCKAPAAKNKLRPFFVANPDAMEAFKKHGIANLKDLSVELMHKYLHQLIPRLLRNLGNFDGLIDEDGAPTMPP